MTGNTNANASIKDANREFENEKLSLSSRRSRNVKHIVPIPSKTKGITISASHTRTTETKYTALNKIFSIDSFLSKTFKILVIFFF